MNTRPVVWALDAFGNSSELDVHFKTALAISHQAPGSCIHPVYVLSEDLFSDRGYSNFLRPALRSLAHKNMMSILHHDALWPLRKAGAFADPEIIVEETAEAIPCAQKLLRYANCIGAGSIAIGTHGRSLVERWFSGSFAESLLHESRLPVLVIGPQQNSEFRQTDLLVLPTDFHPTHRKAFEELLGVAKERDLKIHLLQKPPETVDAWIQTVAHAWGGGWHALGNIYDDDEGALTQEAVSWLQKAHESGVKAHVMTENFRESTAEGIIDYAKRLEGSSPTITILHDDVSDEVPSWLTTNVLRDLIRASPYPLYVTS